MSSIFPVFSSEPGTCSALESGLTPWNHASDIFSMFDSPVCPVEVNPGLEKTNSCPIQTKNNPNPGSEDTHLPDKDERRNKRKKSNRESARRSRIKKQKHLEEVRSQLNQLKTENRDLLNRLRYFMHNCQHAKMESDRLRLEHKVLLDKLLNLRQALVLSPAELNMCMRWEYRCNGLSESVMIRDHVNWDLRRKQYCVVIDQAGILLLYY